ncbi:MAG: hypothetical protein HXY29_13990 [Rhodocyclaceae bacterium]|uniref:VWA domain-containing protein n=1 Tax=candidate division WOR-3 bacterium TaxID=2052148 RepID=A0A7V3NT60_UNCW3|nr:hypothetical protein [Rhodocyclaceae bacterium]
MKAKMILMSILLILTTMIISCQKDTPRSIDVFVDLSLSTNGERSFYKECIQSLTSLPFKSSDELSIFPITSKTLSDSKPLLISKPFPKNDISKTPLMYRREMNKFISDLKLQINSVCNKIDKLDPTPYTDIFSIFIVVSDRLSNEKKKHIIILSDMIEDSIIGGKRYNFSRDPINKEDYCANLIKILKDEDMIPDLSGVVISVCGAKSSSEKSDDQYRSIRKFWELYTKQMGASIRFESTIQNILQ